MRTKLAATMDAMGEMFDRGIMIESYDQMIGEGNDEGNAVVQKVVDKLLDQTKTIERAVATLDLSTIKFEGSDSLDDPNKVIEENKSAGAAPAASPQ
jgi:putative iron-regulated protein